MRFRSVSFRQKNIVNTMSKEKDPVGVLSTLLLIILLLQCSQVTWSSPIASTAVHDNATLVIRPRSAWNARVPKQIDSIRFSPVPFVVIHHTYIPAFCSTSTACEQAMREMQRMHQDDRRWNDIGYTFVIGGDGAVYEGRGWGREGAHAPRYNDKSTGISFIGDFRTTLPTPRMLQAAKKLIAKGVQEGRIREDYVLLGHRQTRVTECPGDALFHEICTWPHFRAQPPADPSDFESYLAQNNLNNITQGND